MTVTDQEQGDGESAGPPSEESPWPCAVPRGSLIADKYRVESFLGEGGMGVVVAAIHVDLDVRVAIKLMLPGLFHNAESAARFEREARATVRIQSDHVARLHDFGRLPDGAPFIVMELLEGESLSALLDRAPSVATEYAVDLVIQACVGVAEAHRLGVIHRDLKPENLFLATTPERGETLKILDFGIAKSSWDGLPTKTEGGMGTPAYAAPEQLRCASDAGPGADLWSLGVVLFELLTGQLPFGAASLAEMCVAVLTKRPPPLRSIRPDLPAALEGVIARCLEVDPALRYQSAVTLALDLSPFASLEGGVLARRLGRRLVEREPSHSELGEKPVSAASNHPTLAGPPVVLSTVAVELPRKRWSRRSSTVAGVLGFATLLLLGSLASRERSNAASPPTVAAASETWGAPPPPPSPSPPLSLVEAPPAPPVAGTEPVGRAPAAPPASTPPAVTSEPASTPTARPLEGTPAASRPGGAPDPGAPPRPVRSPHFDGFGGRR